jgi:hypothetical protein
VDRSVKSVCYRISLLSSLLLSSAQHLLLIRMDRRSACEDRRIGCRLQSAPTQTACSDTARRRSSWHYERRDSPQGAGELLDVELFAARGAASRRGRAVARPISCLAENSGLFSRVHRHATTAEEVERVLRRQARGEPATSVSRQQPVPRRRCPLVVRPPLISARRFSWRSSRWGTS